ncbi:MAG: DUF368 domain-containing protein [Pseudomonadota bacterium]
MTSPDTQGAAERLQAGPERTAAGWLGVFLRGMAMGVAEVIPGVSGGTVAFISGIYHELLASIARFGPATLTALVRDGVAATWRSHNATFLVLLAAGMLASLVSVARAVAWLLDVAPPLVWSFFFGLILASLPPLLRAVRRHLSASDGRGLAIAILLGLAGCALGALLANLAPTSLEPAAWWFVPAGMIAVSAWILPGVSGSMLLLLMGLYPALLLALNERDVGVLLCLALGCLLGLLLFARLLTWLLDRFPAPLLALLTGVMAGSLPRLWPWRDEQGLVWPADYAALGLEPWTLGALLSLALGVAAVWLLERAAPEASETSEASDT